jgi:hypothetical protein
MRELSRAGLDVTVEVPGAGTFGVPPPTVRQALIVLSVVQGSEILPEDVSELRRTTAGWFPLRLQSVVWADKAFKAPRYRIRLIVRLVRELIPESVAPEVTADEPGGGQSEGTTLKPPGWWWGQIARYRAQFGLSRDEVMKEPWPEFVAMRGQVTALEAQETQRQVRANVASDPRAESGDLIDQIREEACMGEPETADEDTTEDLPDVRTGEKRRKHLEKQMIQAELTKKHLSDN